MTELIPAILCHDAIEFAQKMRKVEGMVEYLQVDCMDGKFVPDVTWYDGVGVATMATPTKYDLHLMVMDPVAVLEEWKHVPTVARATFHIEAVADAPGIITEILRRGLEPCVAINPETPLARITPLLHSVESVLVMGVHPGASGQQLVPGTIARIAELRALMPDLPIAVDGGVTIGNAPGLIEAGATRLIAASALYKSKDIKSAIREFQAL
jgi:ribulose-phosphate 3-epimerase